MRSGRTHPWRSRWAALACLAALLCSLSWVRVLGVTAIAVLDPSHDAELAQPQGQWQLVLKHQAAGRAGGDWQPSSPVHRHTLGASVLVLLARDGAPDRDHVLGLGTDGELIPGMTAGVQATPDVAGNEFPAMGAELASPCAEPDVAVLARPPPVSWALPLHLAQIRSTVLRI